MISFQLHGGGSGLRLTEDIGHTLSSGVNICIRPTKTQLVVPWTIVSYNPCSGLHHRYLI